MGFIFKSTVLLIVFLSITYAEPGVVRFKGKKGSIVFATRKAIVVVWPRGCAFAVSKVLGRRRGNGTDDGQMMDSLKKMKFSKPMLFTFEDIKEIRGDGAERTGQGKRLHKFLRTQFLKRKCVISNETMTLKNSDDVVVVDCIVGKMSLNDEEQSPSVQIKICLVKNNGTVTLGDEEADVFEGQIKTTVVLSKWVTCCNDSTLPCYCEDEGFTEWVDVTTSVKTPGTAKFDDDSGKDRPMVNGQKRKGLKRWLAGDGAELELFSKTQDENGQVEDMPEDFPKVEIKGSKSSVRIRCRGTGEYCEYDPVVTTSDAEADEESLDEYDTEYGDDGDDSMTDDDGDNAGPRIQTFSLFGFFVLFCLTLQLV